MAQVIIGPAISTLVEHARKTLAAATAVRGELAKVAAAAVKDSGQAASDEQASS